MDAFVLAGGRGKRLGLLTQSRQKAILCFNDNPLIAHILNGLLQEKSVDKVFVLTGYRGDDINEVLNDLYTNQCQSGKITILGFSSIQGTLSRLTAALSKQAPSSGCCVCGIDSLISKEVLHKFFAFLKQHSDDVILSFSPRLEIATTHKVGCLQGDQLINYTLADEIKQIDDSENFQWCTDVGIRYFPSWLLRQLIHTECANNLFIPSCIKKLLASKVIVRSFVFEENWKHFTVLEDFYGSFTS